MVEIATRGSRFDFQGDKHDERKDFSIILSQIDITLPYIYEFNQTSFNIADEQHLP